MLSTFLQEAQGRHNIDKFSQGSSDLLRDKARVCPADPQSKLAPNDPPEAFGKITSVRYINILSQR